MIEPRLTSDFQIFALKRLVEADGGALTVVRKGDATSGAILVIGQIRGHDAAIYQKYPSLDGPSRWQAVATFDDQTADMTAAALTEYWRKSVNRDPDLWVIELDIASRERLDVLLGTLC